MTRWDDAGDPGAKTAGTALKPKLLPGEDPNTDLLDDIAHWVSVYTELLDSGWELIEDGRDRAPAVDGDLIRAHLQRLEGRLDFWLQKRALLTR